MLQEAVKHMGPQWRVDILETDKMHRYEIDEGKHNGRPHEVRFSLHSHYEAVDDIELGRLDGADDAFNKKVDRMDPVPPEIARTNPAFKRELYAQVIVNLGWFDPLDTTKAASFGYEIHAWGGVRFC